MHIYISPVESEMFNPTQETYLYGENGVAYWFCLHIDEDGAVLFDTTGRMVPIDVDQVSDVAAALNAASAIVDAASAAQCFFDDEVNAIIEDVETDNEVYVQE